MRVIKTKPSKSPKKPNLTTLEIVHKQNETIPDIQKTQKNLTTLVSIGNVYLFRQYCFLTLFYSVPVRNFSYNVKKKKKRQEKQSKQLLSLVLFLNLAFNLIQMNFMRRAIVKIIRRNFFLHLLRKIQEDATVFRCLLSMKLFSGKGICILQILQ